MQETPTLRDAAWLRRRVLQGASVTQIASEVGRTPRGVRYALRDHGIALLSEHRTEHVDWSLVEHDWRKGYPVATIARLYRLTPHQITDRLRDVPRCRCADAPRSTRHSTIQPGCAVSWPAVRASSRSPASSAPNKRLLVAALRRHGITVPPRTMARIERIKTLEAPSERIRAAERLIADLSAELAEARRIRDEARATRRR